MTTPPEPAAPEGPDPAAAEAPPARSALARWLLPGGSEPDARFTLANERTFLAWIRTSLALLGGGIALEAFTAELFHPALRRTATIVLVVIAMVTAASAVLRWVRVERAMREKRPLPVPTLIPVLGFGAVFTAVVLLCVIALR